MSSSRPWFAAVFAAVLAASVLPLLTSASAGAATGDKPLFAAAANARMSGEHRRVDATHYSAVEADLARIRTTLTKAPAEARGAAGLAFDVPTPTGTFERFTVFRTSVMESGLAAAHPELATWSGRSLDHPGTTVAMDLTPMGFHASVRGPMGQRAWYIDPAYNERGTSLSLAYYGGSIPQNVASFAEKEAPEVARGAVARPAAATAPGGLVKQRTYRLALVTDPSYAAYFGTENVLAEKVTLMNRVDQIYNDDLAIRMVLVNKTDDLNLDTDAKASGANGPCGSHPCYDPPGADPEADPGQLAYCTIGGLLRTRTVLSQLVGASNYDIGHLGLGVNGGGVAQLGVVGSSFKAQGCTGLPQPQGDFYAIDYVAHEMGHQFDGNHTFNGTQVNCSGGNRNGLTSVEPGSGSSVMAYAGICGTDDLQPHTDPYFSQRSIEEISAYTGTPGPKVPEVQTVSLRGFTADGDKIRIGYPGSTHAPVTLTRGVDYDTAHITAAIRRLTGKKVTVAKWGYDPYDTDGPAFAPVGTPDDSGFQVIFAGQRGPNTTDSDFANQANLLVTSPTSGVDAFVGETAKGGTPDNTGHVVQTHGDHAPVVTAPADRTIPLRTPFTLTGSGTDSDGDQLTYLWEQDDKGAGGPDGGTGLVDNSKRNGPLFRVFGQYADVTADGTLESPSPGENIADGSPSRTFPDLVQILNGNTNALTGRCPRIAADATTVPLHALNCFSEFLPIKGYVGTAGSSTPALHFRLTARDDDPNGGGVSHDDVVLTIDQKAGPFLVTSQAGGVVAGGSTGTVTWAVNGTTPLAADVKVSLSTDGGRTWSRTLASSTPNDGSVDVQFPAVATTKARIKVEAVGNYFFAVNSAPFTIS